VRVVDDRGKFHLQYLVEFFDNGVDVKLKSPCHRRSPPLGVIAMCCRLDIIWFGG
jgi:hypothetical protein